MSTAACRRKYRIVERKVLIDCNDLLCVLSLLVAVCTVKTVKPYVDTAFVQVGVDPLFETVVQSYATIVVLHFRLFFDKGRCFEIYLQLEGKRMLVMG